MADDALVAGLHEAAFLDENTISLLEASVEKQVRVVIYCCGRDGRRHDNCTSATERVCDPRIPITANRHLMEHTMRGQIVDS